MKTIILSVLLCLPAFGQLQMDRVNPKAVNEVYFANQFANIQAAITQAGTAGAVIIPPSYAGMDTYTNPNGILILDFRAGGLGIGSGGTLSVTTGNITNINSTGTSALGTVTVSGTLGITGTLSATGGITAGGTTLIETGTSSNTDVAGELTNSGGSSTYIFGNSYTSHPICVANDETAIAAVKVAYTGAASVSFTTTGPTDVVSYICIGRN